MKNQLNPIGFIILAFVAALLLTACHGTFVQKAKKAEYAALALSDGGMKSWAIYYKNATNNPAAYGTTLSEVETNHVRVNRLARKVAASARALDTYLAAYQTNSAVKTWIQAAVDSLGADAPQLVALIGGLNTTNQFTPIP